jgi:hypothetical protein
VREQGQTDSTRVCERSRASRWRVSKRAATSDDQRPHPLARYRWSPTFRYLASASPATPPADPLLSSLNSTFAHCDPIVEVDEHPLIDFRQCIRLAEQIDSLVRYSPPRVRTPPDVVAYVEYSLKSCVGDDQTLARSAKLMTEEQSLVDRRERMRSLGMPWSPHPLTRRK